MKKTILYIIILVNVLFNTSFAVDGVIEINQVCALNTGCFIGDQAGYPVVITQSVGHSYRLTSNLIIPDHNTDGIIIRTANVSIDLNGFSIVRSGCEHSCTAIAGSGKGIRISHFSYSNILVKNGNIIGMGSYAIDLGFRSFIDTVKAHNNGFGGIRVGSNSIVKNNITVENLGTGIETSSASTLIGNKSYRNGLIGIDSGSDCIVDRNSAIENGSDGIKAANGCVVTHNVILRNDAIGLNFFGAFSVYSYNMIRSNNTEVSNGIDLGNNFCSNNTTCP